MSRLALCFLTAAAVAFAACAKHDDEPTNNGVNDVHKACEIRTSWKRAKEERCVLCVSAAALQKCDCEALQPFSGACQKQGENYRSTCSGQVIDCASHCPENDCGCLDRCYAAADDCTVRAAQRDGCVAEQCAPYCE